MENNKKVPISSPAIFESLGMSWSMVREATPFEMSIIPTNESGQIGKNMKFYPDGTLVKADDSPQVYIFDRGNLKPINSPAVFFSYGYSFNNVLTFPLPSAYLNLPDLVSISTEPMLIALPSLSTPILIGCLFPVFLSDRL